MKRRFVVALAMLLLSCDQVERRVVTLAFDPTGEHVTITATTYVAVAKADTPAYAEAEERRSALLAERDEWALRFQQAGPETESVTFQRTKGKIDFVERRATVDAQDLQKFFYDTPVTITTTRGDGWTELAIYAGSSMRANAEQRRIADAILRSYSGRAAHYFAALRTMYLYLEEHPQRAEMMFTEVFADEKDARPLLSQRERSMTDAVRNAAQGLLDTNDLHPNVDEIFDLVYNSFPAQLKILIKGQTLAAEGFSKTDSETYEVKTMSAAEAVASLEGRWIAPDPLALAYGPNAKKDAAELVAIIASEPRHADPVVSETEIAAAIVERMRPAPRYRLRWTTKRGRAS